ncbi:hypothetical protein BB560_001051 [Smittium megazygosporum]|uniref:Uncharacterized protein n=1 Tax=Smittium megazygosporum TaxID=133381 RepID=A0A2T9ZIL2_9FUNG|nr:hypothetical protein BB560_001051 [Smittium megazygosporum]
MLQNLQKKVQVLELDFPEEDEVLVPRPNKIDLIPYSKFKAINTTLEEDFFRRTLNQDKNSDIINNYLYVKGMEYSLPWLNNLLPIVAKKADTILCKISVAIVQATRPVYRFTDSFLQDIPDVGPNNSQSEFANNMRKLLVYIATMNTQTRIDNVYNNMHFKQYPNFISTRVNTTAAANKYDTQISIEHRNFRIVWAETESFYFYKGSPPSNNMGKNTGHTDGYLSIRTINPSDLFLRVPPFKIQDLRRDLKLKNKALAQPSSWNSTVTLSSPANQNLDFWRDKLKKLNVLTSAQDTPGLYVFTDSCDTVQEVLVNSRTYSGTWDPVMSNIHIKSTELTAIYYAFKLKEVFGKYQYPNSGNLCAIIDKPSRCSKQTNGTHGMADLQQGLPTNRKALWDPRHRHSDKIPLHKNEQDETQTQKAENLLKTRKNMVFNGMEGQRSAFKEQGLLDAAINIIISDKRNKKHRCNYYHSQQRFLKWRSDNDNNHSHVQNCTVKISKQHRMIGKYTGSKPNFIYFGKYDIDIICKTQDQYQLSHRNKMYKIYKAKTVQTQLPNPHENDGSLILYRMIRYLKNNSKPLSVDDITRYIHSLSKLVPYTNGKTVPKAMEIGATLASESGIVTDKVVKNAFWSNYTMFDSHYRLSRNSTASLTESKIPLE